MSIDLGRLLQDAERRAAAGTGASGLDLGKLLGRGSPTQQLLVWSVLNNVIGAVLAPELEMLTRGVNQALQATPLSAPILADMVVRNIVPAGDAEAYAKQSGVAPSDFKRLVHSAGEPLSLQEMLAAVRRGVVPAAGRGPDAVSLEQAVAESRTYNKYLPVAEALADLPIGVADAVDAVVEGQIGYDQGQHEAYLSGINGDRFRILVNTRGHPPSPTELAELLRRGLIPLEGVGPDALSFQQGIFEGATKDKWWREYAALADYLPPPRTIVAMVRDGSLTDEAALGHLKRAGLSDELAQAYLTSAHHSKTQAQRDLTVGNIGALYRDRLIDKEEATQLLGFMRFSDADVPLMLDLWDFEALERKVRTAVSKVHNLYVAHKIDAAAASRTLDGLNIPPAGRDEMLTVWNLERDANVAQLTAAEIADAVYYSLIPVSEGVTRLVGLGWPPDEAALRIGIRLHGKPPPTTTP